MSSVDDGYWFSSGVKQSAREIFRVNVQLLPH